MAAIAGADAYKCPEPILLIVGGSEKHGWFLYAQVTTCDGAIVELHQRELKKKSRRRIEF